MFDAKTQGQKLTPRAITIELRDGRRLKGVLQLPKSATAGKLLRGNSAYLTIRTPKGDLAIARDNIAALLLGDDALSSEAPRPRNDVPRIASRIRRDEHHRLLSIHADATPAEIKAAYKKRIFECHPDRVRSNGGSPSTVRAAEEHAAKVNAAYATLMARASAA
ncbi:J domain-containing protein [Parvularcula sp. ZS-1/3]|uniref:J domain-containing protein n=1 Tax=Parvularcula mediterranea TaxID=2732508 RepID=A0A7Y3RPH8_9PROT|nr:J domain-containing protein [Parvularcula mediterranea]NNU17007.1 J domain-containing protein [Parvularcula mediterranea]